MCNILVIYAVQDKGGPDSVKRKKTREICFFHATK